MAGYKSPDMASILLGLPKPQSQPLPAYSESAILKALQSDIGRAASSVQSAFMAPGNALRGDYSYAEVNPDGSVNPVNSALMDQASNMAGVVSLGSMPVPKPTNSLTMGANYLRSLDAEVPALYREMNAERANQLMEGRLQAPWGQERLYWSDVPDLAKGQAENTGITMKMRTEGVQGKYDISSKPGLQFVKATGGGKEYVTSDGVDFSKVDEIKVSPAVNDYGTPDDRRLLLQLRTLVDQGKFTSSSPDGFVTLYQRTKR